MNVLSFVNSILVYLHRSPPEVFLEDAGGASLFGQFFHRTEDSVQFDGQVFDLLLERDDGDSVV
jgi:hypothetical protein